MPDGGLTQLHCNEFNNEFFLLSSLIRAGSNYHKLAMSYHKE